jgi:aminopeptidase YwaD
MIAEGLRERVVVHLHQLCGEVGSRQVGSDGNRRATDYFSAVAASHGFVIRSDPFDCIDWREDGATLTAYGQSFEVFASPYSLGCRVQAPLVGASAVDELEAIDATGRVLLLHGEVVREQLMPKAFPFYNPDHHRHIIATLEAKRPLAIIAATSRDVAMVGGQYPFPLIEDGDFGIPSVYLTEEEGQRLLGQIGLGVTLEVHAERIPSRARNVMAFKGGSSHRVVLMAHIDTKIGTPGALDNAGGVTVLLLLAELLAEHGGTLGVELVAINGEDYYSAPGEQQFLAANAGRFGEIVLGINLDGVGYHKGRVAYSLYGCPPELATATGRAFAGYPDLVAGEPWYQGDHALFLMNQTPALALTSELVLELMQKVVHTPSDTPALVDPTVLAAVALALRDLLIQLDRPQAQ